MRDISVTDDEQAECKRYHRNDQQNSAVSMKPLVEAEEREDTEEGNLL